MTKTRRVALIWTKFSPYHVDRCEAVARELGGRAEVIPIEIATRSETYAWSASGEVAGASKRTLFPGRSYDEVPWLRRLGAMVEALRRVDTVFIGVSYAVIDIILLSWWLRLTGRRVVMMTDSKFDHHARRIETELLKPLIFLPYHAALVSGRSSAAYMRFLGYRRRPIVEGYDSVGLDRVRAMAGSPAAPDGASHADRAFAFVGRFVREKNVFTLISAFERYVELAGPAARRLVMVGGGELEQAVHARIRSSPAAHLIEAPGFLQAEAIASVLATALALILPSVEEQWGLVANEALAFNLPMIMSDRVGCRDDLIGSFCSGFVIEPDNTEGFAQAMLALATDEALWLRMVREAAVRAPLADTPRFAAAVASLAKR